MGKSRRRVQNQITSFFHKRWHGNGVCLRNAINAIHKSHFFTCLTHKFYQKSIQYLCNQFRFGRSHYCWYTIYVMVTKIAINNIHLMAISYLSYSNRILYWCLFIFLLHYNVYIKLSCLLFRAVTLLCLALDGKVTVGMTHVSILYISVKRLSYCLT
jgi:hypothetical protein